MRKGRPPGRRIHVQTFLMDRKCTRGSRFSLSLSLSSPSSSSLSFSCLFFLALVRWAPSKIRRWIPERSSPANGLRRSVVENEWTDRGLALLEHEKRPTRETKQKQKQRPHQTKQRPAPYRSCSKRVFLFLQFSASSYRLVVVVVVVVAEFLAPRLEHENAWKRIGVRLDDVLVQVASSTPTDYYDSHFFFRSPIFFVLSLSLSLFVTGGLAFMMIIFLPHSADVSASPIFSPALLMRGRRSLLVLRCY